MASGEAGQQMLVKVSYLELYNEKAWNGLDATLTLAMETYGNHQKSRQGSQGSASSKTTLAGAWFAKARGPGQRKGATIFFFRWTMDLLRVADWIETNIVLVLQYILVYIYNIIIIIQYNYILYTILSMIDYVRFCGIIIIVSLVVGACKAMDNPTSLGVWLAKDTGNRPQFGTWWFPIETSIEFCAFAWILHGFPAIRMNIIHVFD